MNSYMNQQAYDLIRQQILSFEILPGQKVSDFALARQLEVSRTPVREALAMLVRDGLLRQQGKGLVVCPIDADDLRDLCYIREAVEITMMRIILENGGLKDKELHQLEAYNAEIKDRNANKQINLTFEIDEKFHNFISEKANSPRLSEQSRILQLQMRRYRFLTLIDGPARSESTVYEHEAIIAGLKEKSFSAVEQALRTHLQTTEERYTSILKRMPANEWIALIRNITSPQALEMLYPDREKQE